MNSWLAVLAYSMVAGLGICGVALKLAGQRALSNLIGSVIIHVDGPFELVE
jgi:small-conductance mechanosensitive channel